MPKGVRKKKENAAPQQFSVQLDCAGKVYKFTGETVADCFGQMGKVSPIKGFAMVNVSNGKDTFSIRLFQARLRRFLTNKDFKLILAKQITTALL